jgi:hypothetical protein
MKKENDTHVMYLWCILEMCSLVRRENIVVVSGSRGSSVVLPATNWCIVTQITITTTRNLQSLGQRMVSTDSVYQYF